MELSIKPATHNKYGNRALLVKGAAPELWFRELEALNIDIRDIEAFAIPSDKANVLYGCLLIFKKGLPKDTRNHQRFQCAYDKLLIPENADLYPKLTATDIALLKPGWIIAHPDFGFADLDEPVDWLTILSEVPEAGMQLRQPMEGIAVPAKIMSYSVEMDEEDLADSLLPQKTEEEWMKTLPFNLQKVLNGNKKEAEKYLKYLQQYPDRALALGIPLDVMNTSRDTGWSSFNFRSGWLQSMFGGSGSGGGFGSGGGGFSGGNSGSGGAGSSAWRFLKFIAIALAAVLFIGRLFDTNNRIHTDRSSRSVTAEQVKALSKQYKELLSAHQKDSTGVLPGNDNLVQKQKALFSDYLAATYKYGSQEVQSDERLKDSVRLRIDELKLQMKTAEAQLFARQDALKRVSRQQVEKEIAVAEKKVRLQVKDSLARLPDQENSRTGKNLEQLAVENKMSHLRDSLEKQYGLRPKDADVITNASLPPGYETAEEKPGTFAQVMLLLSGLLVGVFIFTKVIKGKTISMGGYQLQPGMKIFLLLVFTGMLVYILYPLVERYGYNWVVWLILLAGAALLYRLLASDKTILKSDRNG